MVVIFILISALNDRLGNKMDKMSMFSPKGIWCSTSTESNYQGSTSVLLKRQDEALTLDTMNKYFGTNYTAAQAVTHFVVIAMNGDGDACGVHISGVQYIPSTKRWVAVAEDSLKGKTFRINWVAFHF